MTGKEFVEQFDLRKNYGFSELRFRKGNYPVTLPFGIFLHSNGTWDKWGLRPFPDRRSVYVHFGVDRGAGPLYNILEGICTFTKPVVGYGSIFRQFPDGCDFEFRIGHMVQPAVQIQKKIKAGEKIASGAWIGATGNQGLSSQGTHSHLEVVSTGEVSEILEYIIDTHPKKEWLLEDLLGPAMDSGSQEEVDYLTKYKTPRFLTSFTRAYCDRKDPVTRKKVRFYNAAGILNV